MNKNLKRLIKKNKKNRSYYFKHSFKGFFSGKNNKFSIFEVVLLLFITLILGVMIGYFATFNLRNSSKVAPQSLISEVYDGILNNYYKEIDINDLDKAAIKGIIDFLDDENTVELEDEQYIELKEQINGYFCGIGITVINEDNKLIIVKVLENSAAEKSGLEVNDIIISVDGNNVDSDNFVELIKGQCGNKLALVVERNGKTLSFNIVREEVSLNQISSQYFDVNEKYIGYIDVDVFSYGSHNVFKKHLSRLEEKGIKSLIIDLRYNPGGSVISTKKIMDYFFEKNTSLYTCVSRGKKTVVKDNTNESRNYPIVILMNEETASAAEMFIYSFKENYSDIYLVGKNTYGKNTIQTNLSLTDDYAIKYTTCEWLSSKGKTVKDKGIKPNVNIIQGGLNYYDDQQLQTAIEYLNE